MVVEDAEPALAGDWTADRAQAAAWAVPPTVLNRMTNPRRANAKQTNGATTRSAILFTIVLI